MLIYLIRHGETDGNRRGVLQGQTNIALNEQGRKLTRLTGRALRDVRFDIVFSSPLSRAYETARIILDENRHPNPEIHTEERLIEIAFGAWEGLGIRPDNYSIPTEDFWRFFDDPFRFEPAPGGEHIRDVIGRTGDFYRELTASEDLQDSTVLVSTHGCALRALLNGIYEDREDFWHGKVPPNCSLNVLRVEKGKAEFLEQDRIFYDPGLIADPYMADKKE